MYGGGYPVHISAKKFGLLYKNVADTNIFGINLLTLAQLCIFAAGHGWPFRLVYQASHNNKKFDHL